MIDYGFIWLNLCEIKQLSYIFAWQLLIHGRHDEVWQLFGSAHSHWIGSQPQPLIVSIEHIPHVVSWYNSTVVMNRQTWSNLRINASSALEGPLQYECLESQTSNLQLFV